MVRSQVESEEAGRETRAPSRSPESVVFILQKLKEGSPAPSEVETISVRGVGKELDQADRDVMGDGKSIVSPVNPPLLPPAEGSCFFSVINSTFPCARNST